MSDFDSSNLPLGGSTGDGKLPHVVDQQIPAAQSRDTPTGEHTIRIAQRRSQDSDRGVEQDDVMPQVTRIGYLGPPGNFTHQDFPEEDGYLPVPLVNIHDVFHDVQHRKVDLGIVPFENSTNGSVTFTLDLFADRQRQYSDVRVCGESFVDVHHNLLGHLPSHSTLDTPDSSSNPNSTSTSRNGSGTATPTTTSPHPARPRSTPLHPLHPIQRLYSHPMAWGQCDAFLSTYLRGVERHDCSSTSRAAELAAADPSGAAASISCISAATAYGLRPLARDIEDKPDNRTRFLTLRRDGDAARLRGRALPAYLMAGDAGSDSNSSGDSQQPQQQQWKSFASFTVEHGRAGALADALHVFNAHGLNLTSINSRPSGGRNWHYVFLVEFLGRGDDAQVRAAMARLAEVAQESRMIGSFRVRSGQ